ncbi:MAG: M20 family metallopeptidase [Chloroflexia bacterium]|nr:M20 family metallopeptidase [Chloroflexia bacterium]
MGKWVPDLVDVAGLTANERLVLDCIEEEAVIAFHQGLVRIPTVNPPGDVREAIAFCEAPLADAGFSTEVVSTDDIMPNLIAQFGPRGGPVLGFNAHVDVVPVGERSVWRHDPFGAEIDDGKIYGRGAGDDKASVTAQVMAGLALAKSGVPLSGQLVVNEVADEEAGGFKGAAFVSEREFFTPDFMIVGEQTFNGIALGEKGASPTRISVRGRTAHGALPWEGANAIEAMAEIIVALRRDYWPVLATRTSPIFHPSSASVNLFEGGIKSNVVPDYAQIYVDRRLIPGERPAEVVKEIEAIARQAVAGLSGITVEVGEVFPGGEATSTPEDSPLVKAMVGANQRLGLSTALGGFSMATDGRFWARKGIPTIIYGPGDPKLAHVPDEWIGIDELLQATRVYALAAVALLTQKSR